MRHVVIWSALTVAWLASGIPGAFFAAPFIFAGSMMAHPRARAALRRAL